MNAETFIIPKELNQIQSLEERLDKAEKAIKQLRGMVFKKK